jgi:hypothetical protein
MQFLVPHSNRQPLIEYMACAGLYEMTNTMTGYRYSNTGMTCKCCKWEGKIVDLLVTPATKSKPRGQEGNVKMSDCNKLWQLCAVDTTGPLSNDWGEQLAGATPRRRGVLLPPRVGGKGRSNGKRFQTSLEAEESDQGDDWESQRVFSRFDGQR